MKTSIRCLDLQGEVVFVARNACKDRAIGEDNGDDTASRIQIQLWIQGGLANLFSAERRPIERQICRVKTALSVNRVAFGAFSGSEKSAQPRCASPKTASRARWPCSVRRYAKSARRFCDPRALKDGMPRLAFEPSRTRINSSSDV